MLLHPFTYHLFYAIMLLFVSNLSGTIQTVINLVLNFSLIFLSEFLFYLTFLLLINETTLLSNFSLGHIQNVVTITISEKCYLRLLKLDLILRSQKMRNKFRVISGQRGRRSDTNE